MTEVIVDPVVPVPVESERATTVDVDVDATMPGSVDVSVDAPTIVGSDIPVLPDLVTINNGTEGPRGPQGPRGLRGEPGEAGGIGGLIHRYMYENPDEFKVEAYDPATGTFTKTGHGLSNNTRMYAGIDLSVSFGPLSVVLPSGYNVNSNVGYYVVNATPNTFQLAETSGGNPVVFGENPSMNLDAVRFAPLSNSHDFILPLDKAVKRARVVGHIHTTVFRYAFAVRPTEVEDGWGTSLIMRSTTTSSYMSTRVNPNQGTATFNQFSVGNNHSALISIDATIDHDLGVMNGDLYLRSFIEGGENQEVVKLWARYTPQTELIDSITIDMYDRRATFVGTRLDVYEA